MKRAEHRAAARIAARQALRSRARSLLVLFLVALPIAALVGAAIMIGTAVPTDEERYAGEFGTADLRIDGFPDNLSARRLRRVLPAGSKIVITHGVGWSTRRNGLPYHLSALELSVHPKARPVAPKYELRRGRWPTRPGEAVASPAVLEQLDADVAERVRIDDAGLQLRIVGEAVRREDINGDLLLVGRGTLRRHPDRGLREVLIDLPPGVDATEAAAALQTNIPGVGASTGADLATEQRTVQATLTGMSFGFTVLALFGTGLIAAAAFGVGARRQLRTLGLIAAAGGEPAHARAVVLWGGALLGSAGSLAGTALAFVAAFIARPHLDELVGRVVGPLRVSVLMVLAGSLLGCLMGIVASLAPARQAARLAVLDALAGRHPVRRSAGRLAGRGVVAVVAGCAITAVCAAARQWEVVAVGLVLTVGGFLLAIPVLVSAVGRIGLGLPVSARLAARQIARYGRRTAAAVAAATLALSAPVTVGAITLSDEARAEQRVVLRQDQISISKYDADAKAMSGLLSSARRAIPGAVVAPIVAAVLPADEGGEAAVYVRGPRREIRPGVVVARGGPLTIATPALLRALHAEPAIPFLRSDRILTLGIPIERDHVVAERPQIDPGPSSTWELPAIHVRGVSIADGELPSFVVSARGARKLGLAAGATSGALLRAPRPLTHEQVQRVKDLAADADAFALARTDYLTDGSTLRLVTTCASVVVALAIVGIAVALVGAESRREHAIFVAVGAGPGRRRRMIGANAGLTAFLAALLAVPAGFVPIAVVLLSRDEQLPVVVPWGVMALITVGAPVVAGLTAALLSREPRTMALLRPIW